MNLGEENNSPKGIRVVAIGGGTGLTSTLSALKRKVGRKDGGFFISDLSAVVTVTDDGGSSGRLRRDIGVIPPGDIRNCLIALSEAPEILQKLFQYRFPEGSLEGHSLGNLLIAALTDVCGDFYSAIYQLHEILAINGKIYPSTTTAIRLYAVLRDGNKVFGESEVAKCGPMIVSMGLIPETCKVLPEVLEAIRDADMVLLGPGSLFTSIIPNILVTDIREALRASSAIKLLILNLMSQPGETDGFLASDYIKAIHNICGEKIVTSILYHDGGIQEETLKNYTISGSYPVIVDSGNLNDIGIRAFPFHLSDKGQYARHNPEHLCEAIGFIYKEYASVNCNSSSGSR